MKRHRVELVLLLAVIALLGLAFRKPPQPGPPSGLGLDGVHPGMCKSRVLQLLGPPASQGPFRVSACHGHLGSYAEWGTPGGLTWHGHPTVTFSPAGRVLTVIGDHLTCDGQQLAEVGGRLGTDTHALGHKDEKEDRYTNPDGMLDVLTATDGVISRMVWTFHDRAYNLSGLFRGDREEDAQDFLTLDDEITYQTRDGRVTQATGRNATLREGYDARVLCGASAQQALRLGEGDADAFQDVYDYPQARINCKDKQVVAITLKERP